MKIDRNHDVLGFAIILCIAVIVWCTIWLSTNVPAFYLEHTDMRAGSVVAEFPISQEYPIPTFTPSPPSLRKDNHDHSHR